MELTIYDKPDSVEQIKHELINNHTIDLPMALGLQLTERNRRNVAVNFLTDARDLSSNLDSTTIKQVMQVMNKLYLFEDIYSKSIDLCVSFSGTKIKIGDTGNKKFDEIVNYWVEHLNESMTVCLPGLNELKKLVLFQWWNLGNCFPYETWKYVDIGQNRYKLPMTITCLNPNNIFIDELASQFGVEKLEFEVDSNLLGLDGRSNPEIMPIKKRLSPKIRRQIKNRTFMGTRIPLNSNLVTHLKRCGSHHNPWGVPFGMRAMNAFADLHRKREMDSSIVESVIRRILMFKIGTDEMPCTDSGRLLRFKQLFTNPEASFILVTPHDITHEDITPDTSVLSYDKKYEHEWQRIVNALPVPSCLLGIEGSRGQPEIEMNAFAEQLKDTQTMFESYVKLLMNKIAQQNDLEVKPKVSMARVNINRQIHSQLMKDKYYTGCISKTTYLEEEDYDIDIEASRRQKEIDNGMDKLLIPPKQPFQGQSPQKPDTLDEPQDLHDRLKDDKRENKRKLGEVADYVRKCGINDFDEVLGYLQLYCELNNIFYDKNDFSEFRNDFNTNKITVSELYGKTWGIVDEENS